jgi:putative hydrolase of the HAD superfamily
MPGEIRTVFLDAGGTMIAPRPSVAEIYRSTLLTLGMDLDGTAIRRAVAEAWGEMDAIVGRGRDRYSFFPGGERGFWRRYVEAVLGRVGCPERADEAALALRASFSNPSVWSVFPEVPATLKGLRDRGVRLGVISNWDSRLQAILEHTRLSAAFDTIVVSCEVGAEKPSHTIFEEALTRTGTRPEEALHVGDDPVTDYEGARAAGLGAALLVRDRKPPAGARCITRLDLVIDLLDLHGRGIGMERPEA